MSAIEKKREFEKWSEFLFFTHLEDLSAAFEVGELFLESNVWVCAISSRANSLKSFLVIQIRGGHDVGRCQGHRP